jgi:uncharacterized cupredoxin-like copper-binding protein
MRRVAIATSCLALALAGCGHASTPDRRAVVGVHEKDFAIDAPAHLRAGDVRFSVDNEGPDAHELIVVRATSLDLPLRDDGQTVSEEQLDPATAGALEPGEPGETRSLDVHLTPGRYVLFCNMKGHYHGGMERDLVVR